MKSVGIELSDDEKKVRIDGVYSGNFHHYFTFYKPRMKFVINNACRQTKGAAR